jgi:hypothetical protein
MWIIIEAHETLVGNPQRKRPLDADAKIILK